MKNAHNTIKRFVLTRSTKNILGQKISYPTKIFDSRTTTLIIREIFVYNLVNYTHILFGVNPLITLISCYRRHHNF